MPTSPSITPLLFPFIFTMRKPGHLTSGILHRPFHLDISHPEFFPPDIPPDISHPEFSPPTFHPDISHPEFFSAAIPSGCLTSRILPRPTFYLIQMSHIRNSSPSPFHPDISHQEYFSAYIPLGCLTSGILTSEILTSEILTSKYLSGRRSTFSGYLTFGILSRRRPAFSGCLTSGILSSRRSTFFFILRAFSLGSEITFLIKLCCHFYFWQTIFILPLFFKMF